MTELACISFFMLVSMVVNWQTSTMTFRLHHHPIQAGDLTKFLLQLIICCLLETYWVNPFPGASFGTHSEQDWAWVVQHLSLGEDAGKLTLALASRRSDKPNPLYYAQRTIDIASARLMLLNGAVANFNNCSTQHRGITWHEKRQ
jgi:hypothetical protein